jgi:hypothetical protein
MRRFALYSLWLIFAVACCSAQTVQLVEDEPSLEFVGQFNNSGAASQQFGYISNIRGLSSIFSGVPQNEATAQFTFVTNATTLRVIANGPLRVVNRTGTTTVYLNTSPADFTNPASFSSGTPIQVSEYSQEVIINILTNAFTTTHMNRITTVNSFMLNGQKLRLGSVGSSFRTHYSGQVNTPGSAPSGWFAGYAVGVDAENQ